MRTLKYIRILIIVIMMLIVTALYINTSIKLESDLKAANEKLHIANTTCLYFVGEE